MGNVKDMFSKAIIYELGDKLKKVYEDFPKEEFVAEVFYDGWEDLELFARLSHIAKVLDKVLPRDYKKSLEIIYVILPECNEAQAMVFPPYVVEAGIEDINQSAQALAKITQYATCEFAVRTFIDKYPDEMFQILMDWAKSDNEHVRRLASEGTRLAIPWGARLQTVYKKHEYAIPILELLKADSSEYVRKSVGNNLNELSKVAPELVVSIGHEWMSNGNKNTNQIVKSACRTLLKKAYPPVMELFGLTKPKGLSVRLLSATPEVKLNSDLSFSFEIINELEEEVKIRIGYDIGFLKSNGKLNFKENRISERMCKLGKLVIERKHKITESSTRKIYPGRHELKITINGCAMADTEFIVK